jgi:broad specificity phosphatase PhoE
VIRARLALAAAIATALWSSTAAAQRVILVVRHAEKQSEGSEKEMPLSAAGKQRAMRLAQLLSRAGVTAVYVTDTVRARETGAPLAREANVALKIYDTRDAKGNMTAEPLAARLKEDEKDGVVLVVGHSNTVPDIIAAYGVREAVRIGSDDYGDLFLLVPQPSGQPILLRLKF